MTNVKVRDAVGGVSTTETPTAREGGRLTALPSRGVGISIADLRSRRCVVLGRRAPTSQINVNGGRDE